MSAETCGAPWLDGTDDHRCGKPAGHTGRHVAVWLNRAGGELTAVWGGNR